MTLFKNCSYYALVVLFIGCSSGDSNEILNPDAAEEETESPIENPNPSNEGVLDLVSVQYVADTPKLAMDLHLVLGNSLYSIKGQDTYVFNFDTTVWTYLGSDPDLPNFIASGISFLRNGLWTIFTSRGLYEFDFSLQDWKAIDVFPLNENFYISAFYIEEQDAIYYVDPANGNRTIYKYLLDTNESIAQGGYGLNGNFSLVSPNTFVHNNGYYITYVTDEEVFEVHKFSSDFTKLEMVNSYNVGHSLDNGVAMLFEDYIIFGLGGVSNLNEDLSVTFLRSDRRFYFYDLVNDKFLDIPSYFYEGRMNASLVTYNNEFYLINGFTIENNQNEPKLSMEKLKFNHVTN
ncbi:hypothetical protein [Flagellimonas marinaquae]|uniref:hypothetical protein n=1 Tax=Flagellimonas marinaquae TaxID=254955 RepID=UPI000F8DFD14|nr:hypothetical protein [Allomuricauda aquimarina]